MPFLPLRTTLGNTLFLAVCGHIHASKPLSSTVFGLDSLAVALEIIQTVHHFAHQASRRWRTLVPIASAPCSWLCWHRPT